MSKPITFPKTGEVWTNADSGVFIAVVQRDGRQRYEVRVPSNNVVGWQHFAYGATLAKARSVAKSVVESVTRPRFDADHAAALHEDTHRTADQARETVAAIPTRYRRDAEVAELCHAAERDAKTAAQALTLARRAAQVAIMLTDGLNRTTAKVAEIPAGLCLRADPPHIPHMTAVTPECRDEQVAVGDTVTVQGDPATYLVTDVHGTTRPWVELTPDAGPAVTVPAGRVEPTRLPVLPTAAEVRNLTAAEAVALAASRNAGCTKVDGWLSPHTFEYHPDDVEQAKAGNDGYDAWERCEKPADDDVHTVPADEPRPTHFGSDYLLPVCEVANDGQGVLMAFAAADVTCPVCLAWLKRNTVAVEYKPTAPSHLSDDAVAGQLAAYGTADYRQHLTEFEQRAGVIPIERPAPPAPADLNDDPAWQAYAAALPTPNTEQYAAVIAEFGDPYAEQVAACVKVFKDAARSLWRHRAEGTLTGDQYTTRRATMRVARECITTYRRLTQAWARRTAEQYTTA